MKLRIYEIDAVNKVARWYTERLQGHVVTPTIPEGYISSWAQYTIRLENKKLRDEMQAKLKSDGIPSMIYYPRGMHQQQVFGSMRLSDELYPNTVKAVDTVLSLPMHPYMNEEDLEKVCNCVKDFLN